MLSRIDELKAEFNPDYYQIDKEKAGFLREVCLQNSAKLKIKALTNVDKAKFLFALSGIESSYGLLNHPRYERNYAPGGIYYKARHMKQAYLQYGALASCSYGPWQIMYIRAYELGYRHHPLLLWDAEVSLEYVIKNLEYLQSLGAKNVEDILDAYNTGSHRDQNIPQGYIEKFIELYSRLNDRLELV